MFLFACLFRPIKRGSLFDMYKSIFHKTLKDGIICALVTIVFARQLHSIIRVLIAHSSTMPLETALTIIGVHNMVR